MSACHHGDKGFPDSPWTHSSMIPYCASTVDKIIPAPFEKTARDVGMIPRIAFPRKPNLKRFNYRYDTSSTGPLSPTS
ncbi:unnamed protein product [Tuber melanosporum]|uniref:(Perigord truffle) hypothetical protein n=1 Tax=Tuber melanosporum (strain Mel28) TaxID=656061 RepID=D5GGS9_TUBMM|nr:uncharacterized protein GSTUM_00007498001 [Tuber melanosporum]CAZ83701.1 unnamed protein product [Tuber melanosporum]